MRRLLRALGLVCVLGGTLAAYPLAAGPVLASGHAPSQSLNSPASVAMTSGGDYFVADAGHNRVAHFASTGAFLGAIGQPVGQHPQAARGELNAPTGVALDGKGHLFVADLGNGRVAEFTHGGAYLGQIGSYGMGAGRLLGPSAVTVGADGRVYVLDTGANTVNIFGQTGAYITRWGGFGSGTGEFDGASGIAHDAAGNIYVADTNNNRVQEFSAGGTYLAQWGRFGTAAGDFRYPTAVAVDAAGTIWVDDAGNGRVVRIQHPQTFAGSVAAGTASPAGIAVAGATTYVVDTAGERIISLRSGGTRQAVIARGGHGSGQLSRPLGVAADAAGNIFVADTNNNRIEKFDASGTVTAIYGAQGRDHVGDSPRFLGPQAVALDGSGSIYVADTFNSRIQKLDAGGHYLWERRVGGQPRGIAVDTAGNIYVTSYFNQKVLKFDPSGTLVAQWGGRGTTNGRFMGPSAIAVDGGGRVFVADTGNNRVAIFSALPDGTYGYSGQFGGAGTAPGQFSGLGGIAVGADNLVSVVDRGGARIQAFNPFGAQFSAWSGNGRLQNLTGVALDDSGNIVVCDALSNHVSVYSAAGAMVRQVP